MPKVAKTLSALAVTRLKEGFHGVGGAPGLHLKVWPSGASSWILRVMIAGDRVDLGLGAYPNVGLAEARKAAHDRRNLIQQGADPRQAKREALAAQALEMTFKDAAATYIAAKAPGWKNAKHADQWTNTLETYAMPFLASLTVRQIDTPHVLRCIEPIWATKTETATRVRNRIELVLDWGGARKLRDGPNPARWKGHLDKLLPPPAKLKKVKHHEAMPMAAVPAFWTKLLALDTSGSKCLRLLMLTTVRSEVARGATWAEFDLEEGVWTVPAERMKVPKEHRVPLAPAAVDLVRSMPRVEGTDLVFPSAKGTPLSDATLLKVMRDQGLTSTPHGFRSTFQDWSTEETDYPQEMADMALAHVVGDKVEAAYRRGDLLKKRRQMMVDWAQAIAGGTPA